ncbi:uncharacterized protein LOC129944037 [Eupeodes corollae]|uniref:uncharacterized protein LOC129944037 n=1 Tax=Eupeodes corollae TaxID=290404 RepID=UPI00249326CE|nr:uncharacterized protein LOC129944037 [Eupeodes corollae]
MDRKGQNSTLETRKLVIIQHGKGETYKKIAELLNMKPNTVGDIVRRYKNEGRIEPKKQLGQPKKLTAKEERLIVRKIKANPRLRAPKIVEEVRIECKKQISASTIRRTIKAYG